MSNLRSAVTPLEHIEAEIVSFPLASEAAFRCCILTLDPDPRATQSRLLWRDAEALALRASPGIGLDQLVLIRDRTWFREPTAVGLDEYVGRVARNYLQEWGGVARPRLPARTDSGGRAPDLLGLEAVRARQRWRWLSFALPPDLLLAALRRDSQADSPELGLLSQSVEGSLVDDGFAELHCHIGAAMSFPDLWSSLAGAALNQRFSPDGLASPGAVFEDGSDFARWIVVGMTVRLLLILFLVDARAVGARPSMRSARANRPASEFGAYYGSFANNVLIPRLGVGSERFLRWALLSLRAGEWVPAGPSFADLRILYQELASMATLRGASSSRENRLGDPAFDLLAGRLQRRDPESGFLRLGLSYLRQSRARSADTEARFDSDFAALFWQVVRLRSLFYRHVVQRPMTPNLQWFLRHFKRLSPAKARLSQAELTRLGLENAGLGRGLRVFEARFQPAAAMGEICRTILEFDGAAGAASATAGASNLEYGIVYHFTKERGGGSVEGRPTAAWRDTHADPSHKTQGFRYAEYYRGRRSQAWALSRVLTAFPRSLETIRGVDVCSDEMAVPWWVLAPLVRLVRDAGVAASRLLSASTTCPVAPLGCTLHCGEDYPLLATGLRQVDEGIRYIGLGEGDRLGHAFSLGVDPVRWAEMSGPVSIHLEDRLLDLVWEWHIFTGRGSLPPPGRLGWLDNEIHELSRSLFGQTHAPQALLALVEDLHDEDALREIGFPDSPRPIVPWKKFPKRGHHSKATHSGRSSTYRKRRQNLLLQYLTCRTTFARGRAVITVDPDRHGEAAAALALQRHVRSVVASGGLVVEVNPTSNLLIENFGEYSAHSLWRMRPVEPSSEDAMPPLAICLGSDDPVTFATSIRHEFQWLYDALVDRGHPNERADAYLDSVRNRGLRSRFTCRRSRDRSVLEPAPAARAIWLRDPP